MCVLINTMQGFTVLSQFWYIQTTAGYNIQIDMEEFIYMSQIMLEAAP